MFRFIILLLVLLGVTALPVVTGLHHPTNDFAR